MKLEVALRKLFFYSIVPKKLIGPAIPQHDAARTVVSFGNDALEGPIFERVIFDHHGQALLGWVEGGAFGDGPGFEDAVDFQAQVIVQVRGVMPLDAELE